MLGSTVFLRIAPNSGQLLFSSTSCPDKALPSERVREQNNFLEQTQGEREEEGLWISEIPYSSGPNKKQQNNDDKHNLVLCRQRSHGKVLQDKSFYPNWLALQ